MRVAFHLDAVAEFEAAARFYADRVPGLDQRCVSAVEAGLAEIAREPTRWAVFTGDIRRHRVRVFPYAVLYTVEADSILVVAVMHCNREPGYWRNRVPDGESNR